MSEERCVASDGLIARTSGRWAKEKLDFLDRCFPPALAATRSKIQRHYVDLFAGPGLNVDPRNGEEFSGSALRALTARSQADPRVYFTHGWLVNLEAEDHEALFARVERLFAEGRCPTARGNVRNVPDDANAAVPSVLRLVLVCRAKPVSRFKVGQRILASGPDLMRRRESYGV